MRFSFLPVLVLLTACASPVVDYQRTADFSVYDSASFNPAQGDSAKTLDASRIEAAIQEHLPARGLAMKGSGGSILVGYRLAEYSQYEGSQMTWGFGATHNRMGVGFSTPVTSREERKLRLELEFVDAATREVVWQVRSAAYLDEDAATSTREKWIDAQIRKMLERYPPGE